VQNEDVFALPPSVAGLRMFLSTVTKLKAGSEISAPFMSFSQQSLSGGRISALIEKPPMF
jgi:hypothetical protein